MRKAFVGAMCLLLMAAVGMAQDKMETKWHCAKATAEHKFDVGDTAGHAYTLSQGGCTATSSNAGEKSGQFTEFQEVWKASYTNHGRYNVTMENGDKLYYTYQGKGDPAKKSASNTWKIGDGTGKHKGAKGSGSCEGKLNDDGSSDWSCSGTLSGGK